MTVWGSVASIQQDDLAAKERENFINNGKKGGFNICIPSPSLLWCRVLGMKWYQNIFYLENWPLLANNPFWEGCRSKAWKGEQLWNENHPLEQSSNRQHWSAVGRHHKSQSRRIKLSTLKMRISDYKLFQNYRVHVDKVSNFFSRLFRW